MTSPGEGPREEAAHRANGSVAEGLEAAGYTTPEVAPGELGDGANPVLVCRALSKHYGGVLAVDEFDLTVNPGEIVALFGDNGAGKSTVIKMLAGAVKPDSGTMFLRGTRISLSSPHHARVLGIETVWQNLAIARDLDVASNMFLGRELTYGKGLWRHLRPVRRRAMQQQALERLADLGIDVTGKMSTPAGQLSGGQVQALAIARAATWSKDLLLLDEPTAALGVKQTAIVMGLCRELRDRGRAIVLISHAIPETMQFADRVVVMRLGRKVLDAPALETDHQTVVHKMIGL